MSTNRYKVVLLGDASVGKSSIVHRYVNNDFYEMQESTIGAAFFTKSHQISDKTSILLEIWDTAGQERYHGLAPMYYRGAHLVLVVFDVTNRNSLIRSQKYIKELKETMCTNKVIIVLIGNKIDIEQEREVANSITVDYAKHNNILYHEVSAKTGENIEEMFTKLCNIVYSNCIEINISNRLQLINQNIEEKNDNCC